MASLLGEGGSAVLSGSCNSVTPATVADFRPARGNNIDKGVDGYPANIFQLRNNDTNSTMIVKARVEKLHANNTTSGYSIVPGEAIPFQSGEHTDEITRIQAWLTDFAGADLVNAATSNAVLITGGVIARRT